MVVAADVLVRMLVRMLVRVLAAAARVSVPALVQGHTFCKHIHASFGHLCAWAPARRLNHITAALHIQLKFSSPRGPGRQVSKYPEHARFYARFAHS